MAKKQSFSTAYKELQNITKEFEQDELDLEKSIPKFKKAAELVKFLKKRLTEIENEIENDRRNKRLEKALAGSRISNDKLPTFFLQPRRATQRSVKFIRWLRNHLYINTSWREAVGPLKRIYAVF